MINFLLTSLFIELVCNGMYHFFQVFSQFVYVEAIFKRLYSCKLSNAFYCLLPSVNFSFHDNNWILLSLGAKGELCAIIKNNLAAAWAKQLFSCSCLSQTAVFLLLLVPNSCFPAAAWAEQLFSCSCLSRTAVFLQLLEPNSCFPAAAWAEQLFSCCCLSRTAVSSRQTSIYWRSLVKGGPGSQYPKNRGCDWKAKLICYGGLLKSWHQTVWWTSSPT